MRKTQRQLKAEQGAELAVLKKAVRENCKDCMNGQQLDCRMSECPLFKWRPYKDKG